MAVPTLAFDRDKGSFGDPEFAGAWIDGELINVEEEEPPGGASFNPLSGLMSRPLVD